MGILMESWDFFILIDSLDIIILREGWTWLYWGKFMTYLQ